MNNILLTPDIIPAEAFHPGEFINDEIKARKITQRKLSELMNIPTNLVKSLIYGRCNISADLALKLEKALEINAEYWMRLQVRYEIDTIRIKYKNELENSFIPTDRKE